jgi:hypothetical protein
MLLFFIFTKVKILLTMSESIYEFYWTKKSNIKNFFEIFEKNLFFSKFDKKNFRINIFNFKAESNSNLNSGASFFLRKHLT